MKAEFKLMAFESKVYKAAKAIPKGQVRSYKWVAGKIGCPRACRAVGNALNRNPYPVIVPCHRVVRSDGSPGGFAKGVSNKIRLLRTEGLTPEKIRDIIKSRNDAKRPKRRNR
ncbi:MAG: MGMT family protein [Candidatus Omnitrophica bacterium]|nr:MGMT family protein [Candidatus Omnitrophota bacterium]